MDDQTTYELTVNGALIKTPHERLTAADIIRLAIKEGAVAGQPDDYVLVSLDPHHQFQPEDLVDILDYKNFVAEKSGSTPVA